MFKVLSTAILLTVLFGCVGIGPEGERVVVVNFAPSPCNGAEQYARKVGAEVTYEELIAETTITPNVMVDYEAELAILQNQSKQACDLFNRGRTTWDQYQSEMREVREVRAGILALTSSSKK